MMRNIKKMLAVDAIDHPKYDDGTKFMLILVR
jgi:hypothetical protein